MKKLMLSLVALTLIGASAFAGDEVAELKSDDIADAAIAIDTQLDGALDADALAAQTENKGTDAQEACYWGGWGGYGYGSYGCYGGCYSWYRPCYYTFYRPVYSFCYSYPVYYGSYWGCY